MARNDQETTDAKNATVIERVIETISPRWALNRHRHATAIKRIRKYEAAEESRQRSIRKSIGSADATGFGSIETLRYRARDLDENYDIASGILDVLESKIVGSEILAHPMVMMEDGTTMAVELNRHLSKLYREWAIRPEVTRQHSLGKSQRLQARSWIRDGEMFIEHLDGNVPGLAHSTEIPYSFSMLEADLVPMSLSGEGSRYLRVRHGVVLDDWGKPIEYLVLLKHPGDRQPGLPLLIQAPAKRYTLSDVKVVPVEDISHIKHVKRIHQTRGISALATVFNRLSDLKDYEESEQTAARIGAYVALAITKSPDADPDNDGSSTPRELDWMPGMIFDDLVQGEKVESIKNERPSNQIQQFRQQSLMAAASGTRAGYSSISKDYNGTYSAQRQELVESEAHYAVMTEELVSMSVRPTYRKFVSMALLKGLVPRNLLQGVDMTTIQKAAYRGPSVAYIDPMKEINHELIGVQAGFFSKQSVQLKRGNNPSDVDAEIEQERERENEMGIVSTSNPANKSTPAAVAAAPAPSEDDEEDEEMVDENGTKYVAIDGRWVPIDLAEIARSMS